MKTLFLMLFTLAATFSQAQNLSGKAQYVSKTKVDMSWMDENRDMTPERRKMIEKNMKQMTEKTYSLVFNRSESVFSEEKELSAPSRGRNWGAMMGTMMGGDKYKNITDGTFTEQRDMMGKTFLIKDEIPKLDWKITGETRRIGNYNVIKATATQPVSGYDWSNWRRKGGKDRDAAQKKKDSIAMINGDVEELFEQPETIEVVAWFTPEIPVQHGPSDYSGLPGLILELSAGNTTLLCSKIDINTTDVVELTPADKGEVVTQKEYDATLKKKMDEMRDRFRGGRGRGRR